MALSSSYRPALRLAMFLQLFLAVFVGMLLDEGVMARFLLIASIAFWTGAALILFRRPQAPTRFDLSYLRIGLVVMLAACLAAASLIRS